MALAVVGWRVQLKPFVFVAGGWEHCCILDMCCSHFRGDSACSSAPFLVGFLQLQLRTFQALYQQVPMTGRSQQLMSAESLESAWHVMCRWRQYVAEQRVNVLRICTIALFYLVHLLRYQAGAGTGGLSFLQDGGSAISYQRHLGITLVVAAWVFFSLTVHVLLLDRIFPRRLPLLSICLDCVFLTAVLVCSSGAASPLVCGYFMIVMMAGLRLDLAWVRAAAGCSLAGYLILLGCGRWPMGMLLADPLPIVPRYHQIVVCLAIVCSGVIVGQIVRHVRHIVETLMQQTVRERQS